MTGARDLIQALTEAYNRHDPQAISALYDPTAAIQWPDSEPGTVEALLGAYTYSYTIMPDAQVTIRHIAGDDRAAIAEVTLSGTNTGPVTLGDLDRAVLGTDAEVLPPTGRSLAVLGVLAIEAAGGRIVADRQYWSPLGFLLQLGLLEPHADGRAVSAGAPARQ